MGLEDLHSDASENENKPFSEDVSNFVNEMACLLLSFAVTSGFLQYRAIDSLVILFSSNPLVTPRPALFRHQSHTIGRSDGGMNHTIGRRTVGCTGEWTVGRTDGRMDGFDCMVWNWRTKQSIKHKAPVVAGSMYRVLDCKRSKTFQLTLVNRTLFWLEMYFSRN